MEISDVQKSNKSDSLIVRTIAKIDTILMYLEKFILSYGVLALAGLAIANVIGRTILNHSLVYVEELSQAIMVLVTFLGLGYCTRKGRHIRMTAFYDQLGNSAKKIFIIVISFVTAATLLYMTYWAAKYTISIKVMGKVTPTLQFPEFIIICWVPLGLLMAVIEYAMAIYKNFIEKEVYLSIEKEDTYEDDIPFNSFGSEIKRENDSLRQ